MTDLDDDALRTLIADADPNADLRNARLLATLHGEDLRYVKAWKKWLVWDGCRWRVDDTGEPDRRAKQVADLLRSMAAIRKGVARIETAQGVAGMLTLASTEPEIALSPESLDADPFLLNCTNGTLDLRTGELRPHDRADLITKVTGAAYRPDERSSEWEEFLTRVQPDPAMRDYLARLAGHTVEGRVVEHVLPIMWGDGANGKGTFLTALKTALGDYCDAADPDLLTARTFDAHPTGTADLFGLRLAVLHESDQGRRLAEGTAKRLTGGDRIKARRMREDYWSFAPSHTFILLTNHKPRVAGTDEGIWRRIRLIPWHVVIPEIEQDGHLGDRLALEADAVLAWLLTGYRDWREQGLADPETVTEATAGYRAESDAVGRFLDERCLMMAASWARASDLFAEWSKWCATEGEDPGTSKSFSEAMQRRGFELPKPMRLGGAVFKAWRGIGLAGEEETKIM